MLLKNKLEKMKSFLDSDNVLANLEERYCYAKDASNLTDSFNIPDLVIFVETVEDVQKIMKYAYEHAIPVVARGAGTNMVGACVCLGGGIVINFSKMNKILEINQTNMYAKVQPGVILGDLKAEVERLNMFYPPDPSNYKVSTIGGSIAQSSGGAKSFKYGTTKDYVLSLKVVTADGTLMTLGAETSKDSVGYHLAQLVVGSEGTLAIVVEATLKLIPKPESKKTVMVYFQDVKEAVISVNKILANNLYPVAIDYMDKNSINTVEEFLSLGLKCDYNCALLLEFEGSVNSLDDDMRKIESLFLNSNVANMVIPKDDTEAELLWQARHSSFAAATRLAPDVVSDDIIVPRSNIAEMILYCEQLAIKYGIKVCLVGHLGDGNLHPQFVLNLENDIEFKNYQMLKAEMYAMVKELGGTISAEHGVGIEKIAYLKNVVDSNAVEYMKLIKKSFDPLNILNPGKIFNL